MDKPKAYVNKESTAIEELQTMLKEQPELYDKCISTVGFAYGFSQLANKAIHFDFLMAAGIIPKDYFDEP